MKTIIYILALLLSLSVTSQSLYTPRANAKVSQTTHEAFSISFKKTMYGITFKPNDRLLTNALKTKIEQFMATTKRPKFLGLGTFTLSIIKRQNSYFVASPNPSQGGGLEDLIEL